MVFKVLADVIDDTNAYTWDRANRLLSISGHSYEYDGDGNRVSQTVSSIVTKYLLDVQPSLVKVIAAIVDDTERYIHGPRGIFATQDASDDWRYMLQDGLGSVRGELEANLDVGASGGYEPYGVPADVAGTYSQPFRFTGEMRDGNALQYHRARYYAPRKGNFLSVDLLEGVVNSPLSLNAYSWVEGNAINEVDPTGNCIENRMCNLFGQNSPIWRLLGCASNCDKNILNAEINKLRTHRQQVDVTTDLQLDMLDFLGNPDVLYIKDRIKLFNTPLLYAPLTEVYKVLDTFIDLVKSGAPLDVKLKYRSQFGSVIWLANDFYDVDITGNLLYGYIGEYVDMGSLVLRVGAGVAQRLDSPNAIGPITCFYDDCADQAAIVAGIQLYRTKRISVAQSDIATVLSGQTGKLQMPARGYWQEIGINTEYISRCLAPESYQNLLMRE